MSSNNTTVKYDADVLYNLYEGKNLYSGNVIVKHNPDVLYTFIPFVIFMLFMLFRDFFISKRKSSVDETLTNSDIMLGRRCLTFECDETAIKPYENFKHESDLINYIDKILSALNYEAENNFFVLSDTKSDQHIQAAPEEDELGGKKYLVEYKPIDEEILYGTVNSLTLKEALDLFDLFIRQNPSILTATKWEINLNL